jgi:hypothetical protein
VGIRDAEAPQTSTASMWCLNLRALMQEPDPCCRDQEGDDSWQQQSAEEIVAMILEHQSSNSTSEYQGDDKVIPEEHGQSQQCFERGRLFCSGYTQGEMAIKMPCIAIYAGKDHRITSMERH